MKCNTDILISYLDNTLPDEEEREFEEHLKQCEVCRETYNAFKMLEAFEEDEEEIKIDIVSKVMDSIDKEKYLNKKYLFVNKILSNKRNIVKYAMVATLALIFTGGFWYSKETNFFGSGKNIANTSKSGNTGAASANEDEKIITKQVADISVNKEMVKFSDIKLVQYDDNFKEMNTVTSKEINKEIENMSTKRATLYLVEFKSEKDLGKPKYKVNIKYEKIKQEYYIYNNHTQWGDEGIILQKSDDFIKGRQERYLLTGEVEVVKSLALGVLSSEKGNNVELPEEYPSKMAKENGDVVNALDGAFNLNKLDNFISNVDKKLRDSVRVISYTIEGDAIITELSHDGQNITAVVDATRDKFAGTEGRNKKQFAISKVVKAVEGERVVYTAKTVSGEDIFLLSVDKK